MGQQKLNWGILASIAGLLGSILSILSFVVQAAQGDVTKAIVLRIIGILGVFIWMLWVSFSIIRFQKRNKDQIKLTSNTLEGFLIKTIYFDGVDRAFQNEIRFGHGGDSKGSDLEKEDLAKASFEGNILKIQRTHSRFRWVLSIIKYLHTSKAAIDRYIPADTDPNIQGLYVRFIYFEFKSYVEDQAHEIYVRLRDTGGGWLRKYGTSEERASRKVRISQKSWEHFDGVLGPIRADEACYVSLDIMPGPTGNKQTLRIKDLKIIEVREEN